MDTKNLTEILDTMASKTDFHGVISIYQDDVPIYESATGYAERSHFIHNTLDTRFGMASGTKFFTALAIGRLIDAGMLNLDTRLNEVLELPFKHYSPEITVQHLLTHTSGIPDYYDEELITDFDNFKVSVPWSELQGPCDYLQVFPDTDMKFTPGERFSYSNGGYILLGIIVEKLTGTSYSQFVTEQILHPIGMNRSGYFAFNRLPDNTAYGYIKENQGWRSNIYNLPIIGASDGGAYTTVKDMRTMWKAFWSNAIISAKLVELFTKPHSQAETEGKHSYYGHGIWIYKHHDLCEEYITGSDAGVSFKSAIIRADNLVFSVISNTSHGAWEMLRVMDQFLGK
jgi:CubicO group peptidase (beta-lactamase class C family)